jgi:endo-1,4-beta-xylanase
MMGLAIKDPPSSTWASVAGRQFDMAVAENLCKFDATEPNRNSFNFAGCDRMLAQAQAANQKFRGHNFIWGQQVPSWVNSLSTTEKQQALINHITEVGRHYAGKVYSWLASARRV